MRWTVTLVDANELLHLLWEEDFQPPHTKATSASRRFKACFLLIHIRKKKLGEREAAKVAPAQPSSNHCNDGVIFLFKSKHFKAFQSLDRFPALRPPTFSLLRGCCCSLLKQLLVALLLSSWILFFFLFGATTSWKATRLTECQMWCRPLSWAPPPPPLESAGACAWIRGKKNKVLRSGRGKSAPAGTWWMRSIKFALTQVDLFILKRKKEKKKPVVRLCHKYSHN